MTLDFHDELELERLIDGELSFAEQRKVLTRLDAMPDGWRRLALALLEQQAFRRELQHIEPPNSKPAETAVAPALFTARRTSHWTKWTTLAAACVMCLITGMRIEHSRHGREAVSADTSVLAAANASQSDSVSANDSLKPAETEPAVTQESSPPIARRDEENDDLAMNDDEDTAPETMKVVFADWDADGEPVEVPVIVSSAAEADFWLEQSAVSSELRKNWESAGYLIYERRKYVPIPLRDGRQGIAPISDVIVEYIGPTEYQ